MKLEHKVPVLIPLHNNLEYTRKAVASLVKHTDPNLFECLLIDNGSTDGTPEYLRQLTEKYPASFRSIRREASRGEF